VAPARALCGHCGWAPEEVALSSLGWHSNRIMAMILNTQKTCIPSCQAGRRTSRLVLIAVDARKWTEYFTNLYTRPSLLRCGQGGAGRRPALVGESRGVSAAVSRLSRPTRMTIRTVEKGRIPRPTAHRRRKGGAALGAGRSPCSLRAPNVADSVCSITESRISTYRPIER
jgi:hypothetical protein